MWIKRDVVMLPTNEKVTSSIMLGVMPNVAALTKDVLDDTHDWMKFGKPQHLYFLSDEEIKGDWYVFDVGYACGVDNSIRDYKADNCRKIITTTDNSLFGPFEEPLPKGVTSPIPRPSQGFIEKFVEEYNKGNIITEVLVEYTSDKWSKETIMCMTGYGDNPDDFIKESALKINPKDNTITIRKVKDSWNKEEVIKLVLKMQHEYDKYKQDCHFGPNLREIAEWTDKWIEQNL